MTKKRIAALVFILTLIFTFISYPQSAFAASVPSIKTTLADGVLKGSKKTFDVWARDGSGNKIESTVKLNGVKVSPTWDDNEKTSYTLVFKKEGENTVSVSAADGGKTAEKTYKITYKKAAKGEKIGAAVWCVELFTIGNGYLICPVEVPIYEGETAATELLRLLSDNGYAAYYGGSETKSFYLAYISDGTSTAATFSGYKKSGSAKNPKKLEINPKIPDILTPHLKKNMSYFDTEDYAKNWKGNLGEFVFTNGSGWMYSVNNVFPNVGFADTYLSDGDVVRVSFTLGYGADIGGGSAVGSAAAEYYKTADKTELTRQISLAASRLSESNVKAAYLAAIKVAEKLNATQSETDSATKAIKEALSKKETVPEPKTEPATPTDTKTPAKTPTEGKVTENPKTETPTEEIPDETPVEEPIKEPDTEVPTNDEDKLSDETKSAEENNEKASGFPVIFIIIPSIIVIAGGGVALYFYMKAKKKK